MGEDVRLVCDFVMIYFAFHDSGQVVHTYASIIRCYNLLLTDQTAMMLSSREGSQSQLQVQ